jgi:hypothetical protein
MPLTQRASHLEERERILGIQAAGGERLAQSREHHVDERCHRADEVSRDRRRVALIPRIDVPDPGGYLDCVTRRK